MWYKLSIFYSLSYQNKLVLVKNENSVYDLYLGLNNIYEYRYNYFSVSITDDCSRNFFTPINYEDKLNLGILEKSIVILKTRLSLDTNKMYKIDLVFSVHKKQPDFIQSTINFDFDDKIHDYKISFDSEINVLKYYDTCERYLNHMFTIKNVKRI